MKKLAFVLILAALVCFSVFAFNRVSFAEGIDSGLLTSTAMYETTIENDFSFFAEADYLTAFDDNINPKYSNFGLGVGFGYDFTVEALGYLNSNSVEST